MTTGVRRHPCSREADLLDILVVCTANIGRSPLLAVLLQDHADQRLGAGAVTVGSAGVDAPAGAAAAEGSRRVAAGWGLSLEDHRATPVRFAPLDDVALIVTMTRRHRHILSRHHERLEPLTFALRELVLAIEAIDDLQETLSAVQTPQARLHAVIAAADTRRPPTRLRRGLDVPDPVGGDQEVFRALGDEFAAAAAVIADALFGPEPE